MLSALSSLLGRSRRQSAELQTALESFEREGYAVLRQVVEPELCDAFWAEAEEALRTVPDLRIVTKGPPTTNAERARPFGPLYDGRGDPDRIIDIEAHAPLAPKLMLHPSITDFLKPAIGGVPTCIQTLTYSHSSQQKAHSDKFLVSPRAAGSYDRDSLAAAWIALEAADDGNGALIVWPTSHRLEKPKLKDDFGGDYRAYTAALQERCAEAGIEPIRFHAEKGDVLFWHGDLVHGGGPIGEEGRTRKSLVCHYAALGEAKRSRWKQKRIATAGAGKYYLPA